MSEAKEIPVESRWIEAMGSSSPEAWLGVLPEMESGGLKSEEFLLNALKHQSPLVRRRACQSLEILESSSDAIVASLLSMQSDDDPVVSLAAVNTLVGVSGHDDSVNEGLRRALSDSDRYVRLAAISGLAEKRASTAPDDLLGLLTDPDTRIVRATIEVLPKFGDRAKDIVPRLVPLLANPSERVRALTATTLGKFGSAAAAAVDNLAAHMGDPSPMVRAAVGGAIREIGANDRIPIEELVKGLGDPDADIRREALVTLRMMGPVAAPAMPVLLSILQKARAYESLEVSQALGAIGAPAIAPLHTILLRKRSRPVVLRAVLDALGYIGPPAAIAETEIRKALSHPDYYVRWRAAAAIGHLGPGAKKCTHDLVACLKDENSFVRESALRSLIAIQADGKSIAKALIDTLKAADSEIRLRAVKDLVPSALNRDMVVRELIEFLDATDQMERGTTVQILPSLGAPARNAVPRLLEILKCEGEDLCIRVQSAAAASQIDPGTLAEATPYLLRFLRISDTAIATTAAELLSRCETESGSVLPELHAVAQDTTSAIREVAAKAAASLERRLRFVSG